MICTWVAAAHMNAQITASGKKNPSASPALIAVILTPGATPTMPIPFWAAAMIPAVCVPWPLSSCAARPGTAVPDRQFALFATSMLAARSGFVKSIPVSMSPTRTPVPVSSACASGAWIWSMSHCRFDRLSPVVATETDAAAAPALVSDASGSWTPNPFVADTPWTLVSFFIVAANPSFDERAMATPICG